MEKMSQQEYKSEAICNKVDLDIYDDLDLTLNLGLPNQAMKSSTMIVPVSGCNKENAMFCGSSTKQMSWPLMSNQSIMMNSKDLVQMSKAIIREAPAPSNITMMSISCNYHNMNNRIAYPPENQINYDCYIILDPSKKTRGRSSSSSRKKTSKTKTMLQSASPSSSSSDSRRGKSNTEFTKPDQRDPNRRCTNYNCGVRFSPMWRRGPLGPKSLCNACGIRFRKQEQKRMEEENTANEAVKMAAAELGSEISCTSTANTY